MEEEREKELHGNLIVNFLLVIPITYNHNDTYLLFPVNIDGLEVSICNINCLQCLADGQSNDQKIIL